MFARKLLPIVGVSILAFTAPASGAQVEKIAGGLDNPRHLAFGDDALYVAESGRGGAGPCFTSPEQGGDVCVGATGAVTVIDEDGRQSRLVEGLASLAAKDTGTGAIGPHGIFVKGEDRVLITNGGPTEFNRDDVAAQNPIADLFGRVLRIEHDGDVRRLVDVWGFERDENPDGGAIDSNPVDVLADGKRLIVADAGGNTLLKARKSGRVELLSLFGERLVPSPFGGEMPMQAVPTGVVEGPDGDYFMSQLTGFPFPVGAANVFRVDRKTGEADVFASGFTNIMDLAFGEDGTLWVLEIDHDSLFGLVGPSTDGALFSVDEDGAKQQLALPPGTLTEPGGITAGERGSLYVTNKSTSPGEGEVLRIDVEADEDEADEEQDEDEEADDD